MQLLQSLLPSASLLRLDSYTIEPGDTSQAGLRQRLTLNLSSRQAIAQCPLCGGLTERIHSHYERTLADVPCVQFSLRLIVKVCKFFCPNKDCRRRIFTERLPEVAAPWARKTVRFVQQLQAIGLALGGAAGARLGASLGYASCGSTLLNHLQRLPLPDFKTPKILGVDDFAFRKGHNYGTILVDLETHQPIELLADRKAETLAEWLKAHPGIEVLSRDRSKTYKSAMDTASPAAIQVADRFHLVKNLSDYLEEALKGYRVALKSAEQAQHQSIASAQPEATVVAISQPTSTAAAQQSILENQKRRVQLQQTMRELRAQLWTHAAIAQEVSVSIRTVERYLAAPDFPNIPAHFRSFGSGILDPYKKQLLAWWNTGIREPSVLVKLLKQEGYEGTGRTVQRYISGLRQAQGLPPVRIRVTHSLPKVTDPQAPPFTPKQAAFLMTLRPENRKIEETEILNQLTQQHPDLASIVEIADGFLQLLRQRQADQFDDWLLKTLASSIKPLQTFAKGLLDDYAAVKASMMMEVSNGPVEGLNNKLKMLKRQMYGRAGLDLLTKRFIMHT
jgi:transposase